MKKEILKMRKEEFKKLEQELEGRCIEFLLNLKYSGISKRELLDCLVLLALIRSWDYKKYSYYYGLLELRDAGEPKDYTKLDSTDIYNRLKKSMKKKNRK